MHLTKVSKYVRQKVIKLQRQMNKSTTLVIDFIIFLSVVDRLSKQKMNKDTVELINISNQLYLINIYLLNISFNNSRINTLLNKHSSHGTFTKIGHISSHKTTKINLKEYKMCSQTTVKLN